MFIQSQRSLVHIKTVENDMHEATFQLNEVRQSYFLFIKANQSAHLHISIMTVAYMTQSQLFPEAVVHILYIQVRCLCGQEVILVIQIN